MSTKGIASCCRGFTLPEVVITMSIVVVLLSLTTINLFVAKDKSSLSTTITTLVVDINQQRLKAMVGDTEGETNAEEYGIYFGQTNYTVFKGSIYLEGDPSNFSIELGDNIQFANNTWPSNQIVFAQGNGDVINFTAGANTIAVENSASGEQKTITINRFGTAAQVN